jgi:hypothetical protein
MCEPVLSVQIKQYIAQCGHDAGIHMAIVPRAAIWERFQKRGWSVAQIHEALNELESRKLVSFCESCGCFISLTTFHKPSCHHTS